MKALYAMGLAVSLLLVLGAQAFAATAIDYANVFSGAKDEALGAITAVLPLILAVFAVVLGVRLAMKFFRTATGR